MSEVLSVAIGLTFLLALSSLLASAVVEGVAGIVRMRSAMLRRTLAALVTGRWERSKRTDPVPAEVARFLFDPTIATGSPAWMRQQFRSSYLPTDRFVDLVFTHYLGGVRADAARVAEHLGGAGATAATAATDATDATLQALLPRLWRDAGHDVSELRRRLGDHYDQTMDRVSGWYRRRTRWMLFGVGLVLAVGFNIGLLSTARVLWTNQAARTSLEAAARQQVQNGTAAGTGGPTGDLAVSTAQLRAAAGDGLPIGWNAQTRPSTFWGWLGGVAGWLAMAVGVSFGAPFWFDALGRIVNLRLSGPKPGERSDPPGGAPAPPAPTVTVAVEAAPNDPPAPAPTDGVVATGFDPAVHGFHFDNDFVNAVPLPFGAGQLTTYGRCGGMVYAGLDLYRAGVPVPTTTALPADDSPLATYLLGRLFDSWTNESAIRFLSWSLLDDAALAERTQAEAAHLCALLDAGAPTPLGLISADGLADVGHNHQVLAVGYERRADGALVIHTWDNNHADVTTLLTITPGRRGVVSSARANPYRGLFVHTYVPRTPPVALGVG